MLHQIFIFILNLDHQLVALISTYGAWTYLFLFLIIFFEAAIIFIAFLPGDSILFAAGALAGSATNILNIHLLFFLLVTASVMGNGLSYFFGKRLGPKIFNSRFLNKKHLERTHRYYDRFGGKTIIIARFIPIIRTIAPFIAGIDYMTYRRFFIYNLIGCLSWAILLLYGSFLFGNIPFVKKHFYLIIAFIILLSVMPLVIGIVRSNRKKFHQD